VVAGHIQSREREEGRERKWEVGKKEEGGAVIV
jgi:hypothetical protein